VNYATANSTAIAGINYTSERGTLGWGNGDTAPKKIVIPISNAAPFTGTKKFAIAIAGAENVDLGTPTSAIVTIDGSAGTAPSVSLSASPTSVTSGGGSTLSWSATNATGCTASGGWTGSVATSGSKTTGALSASRTYTLTCTGAGGSTTKSVTVDVGTLSTTASTSAGASCTGTSGAFALRVKAVRDTGVSPFLVFFDATGTTDSSMTANTTAFQDVSYTWNFGDTGASGTETWPYGAHPGHNSRNTAIGGVAAHLYVTPGVDTAYVVTVTAHNGSNTASCQLGVTAYDPASSNGFPGKDTTCVSSSGTPVAGSGGCPAGAAVLNSSSESSAVNSSLNGKQVLFKCGDTFTGGATFGGTKFSIGAYGGCQGTKTNRPIMRGPFTVSTGTVSDGRVSDIDFESTGSYAISTTSGLTYGPVTLYNLLSNGNNTSYYWSNGTQWGIVDSVMTGQGTGVGTFINYAQNNCVNGSTAYNCGGTPAYTNVNYQAVLGNSFNGQGTTTGGETVRVSACRLCVLENNTFENAQTSWGAVLKLHSGNTYNTQSTWIGQYTELVEISDNLFTGTSGAQLVETSPQNGVTDERLRNIVVERNVFAGSNTGGGRQLWVSGVNMTVRDNAFDGIPAGGGVGVMFEQRGIEPAPQYAEAYNNTCYGESTCVLFSNSYGGAAGANSAVKNNLAYNASGGTTVSNSGSGNTVSNNTVTTTNNPGFTNGSGSFRFITDFKPTANYSGGTNVPVWYDALGVQWPSTWDLGAVHP
jgi:hypothetical protein